MSSQQDSSTSFPGTEPIVVVGAGSTSATAPVKGSPQIQPATPTATSLTPDDDIVVEEVIPNGSTLSFSATPQRKATALLAVTAIGILLMGWGLFKAPFFGVDVTYWERSGQTNAMNSYQVLVDDDIVPVAAFLTARGYDVATMDISAQATSAAEYGYDVVQLRDVQRTAAQHALSNPLPFDQIMIATIIAGLLAALALFVVGVHPLWALASAIGALLTMTNYAIPPVTEFQQVPGFGGFTPLGVVPLSGPTWVAAGLMAVLAVITVALIAAIPRAWGVISSKADGVGSGLRTMVEAFTAISQSESKSTDTTPET